MDTKAAFKALGEGVAEAIRAATPALKELNALLDEAAGASRERFEARKAELQEQRARLDEELDARLRK